MTSSLLLILLAAAVRSATIPASSPDGVSWTDPDSWVHARRVENRAEWGRFAKRDLYLNFPLGSSIHWPEGYDRALAYVAIAFGEVFGRQMRDVTRTLNFASRALPAY